MVTVKAYIRRGLLARVRFYGAATRYPREHLLRLLAVKYCKAQGIKRLDELRLKLDRWSPEEMEQWVRQFPLEPITLAALDLSKPSPPHASPNPGASTAVATSQTSPHSVSSSASGAAHAPPSGVDSASCLAPPGGGPTNTGPAQGPRLASPLPNEAWQRFVLMPGVELQIQRDAPTPSQRFVEQLLRKYTEWLDNAWT